MGYLLTEYKDSLVKEKHNHICFQGRKRLKSVKLELQFDLY